MNECFAPFRDEYTARHFQRWLEQTIHEDERETVTRQIKALLWDDDTWQDTHSWPTMRRLAEIKF